MGLSILVIMCRAARNIKAGSGLAMLLEDVRRWVPLRRHVVDV